jgi:hypothetical protein
MQTDSPANTEDVVAGLSERSGENSFALNPSEDKAEPLLWFKCLVIWSKPSEPPIRTIEFHTGLNIIWSDRDGTGTDGNPGMAQMDVGNTSLVRLMRYCMGEAQFGPADHELRVRQRFPNGAVGAVIRLQGADWAVVRAFSEHHESTAHPTKTLEEVWKQFRTPQQADFRPFLEATAKAFKPTIPTYKARAREIALGFISRDHNGGFLNAFRWRASHNNSGPIVKQRRREWALCALLDFTAADTAASAGDLDRPQRTKVALHKQVAELWSETVKKVGLFKKDKANIAKLVEQANAKEAADQTILTAAQERLKKAQSQVAEISTCEVVKAQLEVQLNQAKQSLAAVRAHQIGLGEKCLLTDKGICDLVNEQGCLVGKAGCDPNVVKREVRDLESTIKILETDISKNKKRIDSLTKKLVGKDRGAIENRIAVYESQVKIDISNLQRSQTMAERSRNLALIIPPDQESGKSVRKNAENTQDSEPTQTNNDNFKAFCATYQKVVAYLISPTARSVIKRSSKGIGIQVKQDGTEYSGSSVGLMKLLALDFAVLVRSIESPVFLPGLLIHDSPRQQDMTNDEYWRLFRLARLLEQKQREQKFFQYVITTPSPPPPELCDDDHVVLKLGLSQSRTDGLLFRSRF